VLLEVFLENLLMEIRLMRSQAMTVRSDNTSDNLFNGRYVDPQEKEITPELEAKTKTDTEKAISYIAFPYKATIRSDTKERQVGWWIGHVENVYEDYFTAVLEDLHGRVNIAEFDKEEITPSELTLLVPNARFTFTITQVDKHSGREYVSKTSFSGPAIWTEKDIEKAKDAYNEIFPEELFNF